MGGLNPIGSAGGFRSRKTLELVLFVRFNQMDVPASSSYLWGLLSKSFFFSPLLFSQLHSRRKNFAWGGMGKL